MKKLLATLTIAITSLCSTAVAGTMTDNRDGHVYKTVQIGSQLWMAENMTFKSDDSYPPNGNYDNIPIYGRLYSWQAAKMACPRGWHLPSIDDFVSLLITVCGRNSNGKIDFVGCGTKLNNRGFSTLHAGLRDHNGKFNYFGSHAGFWSSSPFEADYAYKLEVGSSLVSLSMPHVNYAYSVRCLKDEG